MPTPVPWCVCAAWHETCSLFQTPEVVPHSTWNATLKVAEKGIACERYRSPQVGGREGGAWPSFYQPPLVVEGELGLEPLSQVRATSAASSLALLRFLPSYQYLALCTDPCTVTLLDHAVRPPEGVISFGCSRYVARQAAASWENDNSPRLSDTIWKTGAAIWYS